MSETADTLAVAQTGSEVVGASASLWSDAWRELRRRVMFWVSVAILLAMGLMAAFPALFTDRGSNDRCDVKLAKHRPPSWNPFAARGHPFGYDTHGCDYWAQIVHGARAPMIVGFVVTGIALSLAIVLGSLSGYFGRWLDTIISRLTDILFGLPLVLGALVILTAFPDHGVWTMSLVLGVLWWPTMTRLMRGQVLSVRDADYVQAARMLGAGDVRIMARHILPNAIAPVFVYAMLNVGVVIGYEATLDYLGVGLQYPTVSWGLQLSQAQELFVDYPYLLIYPAILLTATVLSFLLLGDAVRDALDPKLR
ncbi:ABC transporter permease [Actinoallomurus purpureus]|uniref:ABC transporter permease n=1 Tax=Actinoallomurus purpureus TaxID=478114 RepID=UPI002092FE09|nr:ABC transporter permease [Actinoallomurus purpureus]MCO6006599.1 ABC transporter permease [Actinoallomurus purpureus]